MLTRNFGYFIFGNILRRQYLYWLDVAHDCKYITKETSVRLKDQYDHIIAMLVKMINNPENWKR